MTFNCLICVACSLKEGPCRKLKAYVPQFSCRFETGAQQQQFLQLFLPLNITDVGYYFLSFHAGCSNLPPSHGRDNLTPGLAFRGTMYIFIHLLLLDIHCIFIHLQCLSVTTALLTLRCYPLILFLLLIYIYTVFLPFNNVDTFDLGENWTKRPLTRTPNRKYLLAPRTSIEK